MSKGFLHNKPSSIIPDLLGTLAFTGTYNSATYINVTNSTWACNANNEVVLVVQGGTTTGYENIIFTLTSVPSGSGITLKTGAVTWSTANPVSEYYGCILSGVTKKINITADLNAVNTTYDTVTCALTVTYA